MQMCAAERHFRCDRLVDDFSQHYWSCNNTIKGRKEIELFRLTQRERGNLRIHPRDFLSLHNVIQDTVGNETFDKISSAIESSSIETFFFTLIGTFTDRSQG